MRSENEQSKNLEDASYRELRLLEEIHSTPDLSQRQLSRRLGIALGVANLLVRNMVTKGYIKMTHLSWKRWVYVITPRGMARKINLTISYIDRFMGHYQRVRQILREDFGSMDLNEESKVAIVGTSEFSELAYLAFRDIGVDDIDIFARNTEIPKFLGITVQVLEELDSKEYSKVVVAESIHDDEIMEEVYACGVSESQMIELLSIRGSRGVNY